MKVLKPLHGRANVILRADIHNAVHGFLEKDQEIDTELFGKVRVAAPIQYQTPVPRNAFAFGQIGAMGQPAAEGSGRHRPMVESGDIVGFDLYQCGHEIDATPYYEGARTFVTLPWKEILCVFRPGKDLPIPVGQWIMVRMDEIQTRRLLFGGSGAGKVLLPDSARGGVATNKGKSTKVKLAAARVAAMGNRAIQLASGELTRNQWVIYNPMDAVDIAYTKKRQLTFVQWDDLEQVVEDDDA